MIEDQNEIMEKIVWAVRDTSFRKVSRVKGDDKLYK